MKAILSPQPGLPRKHAPYTPLSGSCIAAAAPLIFAQESLSRTTTPAASVRSFRYITIEDSP